MKKLVICSVAAAALLLTSCASSKVEDSEVPTVEPAFEVLDSNISWEAAEFTKDGKVVEGSTATIKFENPTYQVYGNDGVNQYFGGITIDGTAFGLSDEAGLGRTMMAGSEEAMAFADAYMKAITHADTIGRNGENLVISGPKSEIVYEFNGEEFETVSVKYDGKEITGAKATLVIGTEYDVYGNAGVNTYNGNVVLFPAEGFSANAEEFGTTKMMGRPDAQAYEDAFLASLSDFDTLSIENGTLIISGPNAEIYFNAPMAIAD